MASFASLALVVAPLIANRRREKQGRVFRGTTVPYRALSRRTFDVPWRLVVAFAAVALVAAFWRPTHSGSQPQPVAVSATGAIGPGIGIDVKYADGSGRIVCTAGFLVRTRTGTPGLLTAGHCNRPGGQSTVTINYSRTGSNETVGTFTETVVEGNAWDDDDIALITLDNAKAIRACVRPVILSKNGKVGFAAPGGCGGSGGPVYSLRPDGTAMAVGVHVAGSNADDREPSCDAHRFSVAELIQPWLDKWGLTIVTAAT